MTFRPALLLFACLFLLAAPATEVEAQNLTLEIVPATRVNTSRPLRTMAFAPGLHRDFLYVVPNKPHKFDTRRSPPRLRDSQTPFWTAACPASAVHRWAPYWEASTALRTTTISL